MSSTHTAKKGDELAPSSSSNCICWIVRFSKSGACRGAVICPHQDRFGSLSTGLQLRQRLIHQCPLALIEYRQKNPGLWDLSRMGWTGRAPPRTAQRIIGSRSTEEHIAMSHKTAATGLGTSMRPQSGRRLERSIDHAAGGGGLGNSTGSPSDLASVQLGQAAKE